MGGGEAERARRAAEGRQPLEHRARPPDDQLDDEVEPDRDRPEDPATTQSSPLSGSDDGEHPIPITSQIRAVLADLPSDFATLSAR